MSTTTTHPESYECSHCQATYSPPAGRGAYCSDACFYIVKGESALQSIGTDHYRCSTCFRPVKEIEMPPERVLEKDTETVRAMIGFQYATEQTVWATDEFAAPNVFYPIEGQRWGCECGNVNPTTHSETLAAVDPAQTLISLWHALRSLYRDDRVAHAPSKDALLDAYTDRPNDWPYVAGRAIYAD